MSYKTHSKIYQVYNAGVVEFHVKETKRDHRNTPIRNQFELQLKYRDWYRKLGITAEDTYYANADNTVLTRKIAIRGDVDINVQWVATIEAQTFSVYRVYYNYRKNETEISLAVMK